MNIEDKKPMLAIEILYRNHTGKLADALVNETVELEAYVVASELIRWGIRFGGVTYKLIDYINVSFTESGNGGGNGVRILFKITIKPHAKELGHIFEFCWDIVSGQLSFCEPQMLESTIVKNCAARDAVIKKIKDIFSDYLQRLSQQALNKSAHLQKIAKDIVKK